MSGTTIGIVAICAVAVVALAVWLVIIGLAARRPGRDRPSQDQIRGLVQGGQHVGGGRSVAPTRDAPVPEGGGDPPTLEEEIAAREGQADQRRSGSGNPMDL